MKKEVATRIAAPAWMVERQIPAGPFALTAYERIHKRFAPAHIYIEGGDVLPTQNGRIYDPTPQNPVALHLAAMDKADNVIYLARPCQYSLLQDPSSLCDRAWWNGRQFAPEILHAYDEALNEIRQRYNIDNFHIIGFSGGGTIATLLAARRDDIKTLRTVAGNLDHRAHSAYHHTSVLHDSLNPSDYASSLRTVPQHHFIGGQDSFISPGILHTYLQAIEPSSCVSYTMVQEAEHTKGWVEKWPDFLKKEPACRNEVRTYAPNDFVRPKPVFVPRPAPSKP